jgi:hypothetical protein
MQLPHDDALILTGGAPPIRAKKVRYFFALIEHGQETLFELTAHTTRFVMSVSPDIPEMDKADVNARGSERFRNVIAAMVAKLRTGRSILRDQFGPTSAPTTADSSMGRLPNEQRCSSTRRVAWP